MTATRWAGAHALDEAGNVIGGITGRDGSHLSDADLDAWANAFAVPEAETPVPAVRRRGRPTVTGANEGESPRITVRLSTAEIRALDELAGSAGTTRADLTRLAVAEFLKRARGAGEPSGRVSSEPRLPRQGSHASTKKGSPQKSPAASALSQEVRAWARDNDLAVSSRGRLSTEVLTAYERASR